MEGSPPGCSVPGILQARTLDWVSISLSMHESEKWQWICSVLSNSERPHRLQPTRLLCPWDFLGKSTRVGCHCLLHLSEYENIKLKMNPLAMHYIDASHICYIYIYILLPITLTAVFPFTHLYSIANIYLRFIDQKIKNAKKKLYIGPFHCWNVSYASSQTAVPISVPTLYYSG